MRDKNIVALSTLQASVEYPQYPPFYPGKEYPEFKGRIPVMSKSNYIYDLFRELLCSLEMDICHYSTADWNPLAGMISPGQRVLVKPNLVRHIHLTGGDYEAVVTHGSLIRCVLDYIAMALRGRGQIVVGDAPLQSADFSRLDERLGLTVICEDVEKHWGIPIKLMDFRLSSVCMDETHVIIERRTLGGDPSGYCRVNLGRKSLLAPIARYSDRYRVTNYECGEMIVHHNDTVNEYLIPRTVLEADVVINVPKLKTHRKAGITCALKNLVGINGYKDWLPHHRKGPISEGGDEYHHPSRLKDFISYINAVMSDRYQSSVLSPFLLTGIKIAERFSRIFSSDSFIEGSWYGNDTLWRTVLDLNRLLLYADKEGQMQEEAQRTCFTFVDAIVAGEGEGPMEPVPKRCGILAGGMNAVAVDTVLATLMGFDFNKIPLIANGLYVKDWPLIDFKPEDIKIKTKDEALNILKIGKSFLKYCFLPSSGWIGHVEAEGWKKNTQ